jgi:hypothetical protein
VRVSLGHYAVAGHETPLKSARVIEITDILGGTGGNTKTYLYVDQVHNDLRATDPELVEGGQFGVMTVTNTALGFNHSDTTPHPAPGWASSCVDTTAADGAVCFVNVTCDGKPF